MAYKLLEKTCAQCGVSYMGRPASAYCSRRCSKIRPLINRLSGKTQKMPSGCWEFTGGRTRDGYGSIGHGNGPGTMLAHRAAYLLAYGELPDELEICHHCDNPPCVNPEHLFAGTHQDNMDDSSRKNRRKGSPGTRNGSNKFPVSTILRIRQLGGTMSQQKIADLTGVHQTTVSLVLSRKIWRSLP